MTSRRSVLLVGGAALAASRGQAAVPDLRARELAFAATMAQRDEAGFASFLNEQTVFINGGKPLRGKAEVMAVWSKYFRDPKPPFSWHPELAEVLSDGLLGMTEGPVVAPDGRLIARFYSVWRRQPGEDWMMAFDNGYLLPACV